MRSETELRLILPPGADGIERAREGIDRAREATGAPGDAGFGQQLGSAIQALDHLQTDADGQAEAIAQGGGNLHEVALAFEKADVAMRLATKVRNKVVDAYTEIMKMSV